MGKREEQQRGRNREILGQKKKDVKGSENRQSDACREQAKRKRKGAENLRLKQNVITRKKRAQRR